LKPKDKEKLLKEIGQTFPRLGGTTQPFAWGAVQVFNENGKLSSDVVQVKLVRAKADETELQQLEILKRRQVKEKKLALIPCNFQLSMKILENDTLLENLVNSSLLPVKKSSVTQPVIRDIARFHEPLELLIPNLEFQNLLYIYPESLNF
jgi:hypothetical protein